MQCTKIVSLFSLMVFSFFSTIPEVWAQQFLPVSGIVNARDLGGYKMENGQFIRKEALLRSAHLADATSADVSYLSQLPVELVADFRMDLEKTGKMDKIISGARYANFPINAAGPATSHASEKDKKRMSRKKSFNIKRIILFAAFNDQAKKIARDMYPTIMNYPDCQGQMSAFLHEVVKSGDNGAILFHCTQGKDRTGVASALLLAALGASRETIVADFDVTNHIYAKDVKRFTRLVKLLGGKEEEVAVVKAFLGANTENFIKTLDQIEAKYGSLIGYLKGPMGLTDQDLETLRARYLVDTF